MKKINLFNLKGAFSKINYHFNKKKCLLIFLLLFIGVLLPALSGSESSNFWNRLYNILNNPVYNMLFFISIGINLIYLIGDMMNNYMIISRYDNFNKVIKTFVNDVVIFTLYLSFVSFIMAIAGSIIFSFGDFNMINHPVYDIPLIFYILFFLLRSFIIASIVNSIIFIIYIISNKILTTIIILINSAYFLLIANDSIAIKHFYNMHLLFHNYYTFINYGSFFLEIIISAIEICFLIIIEKALLKLATSKRGLYDFTN